MLDSKEVAAIVVFAALTVSLTLAPVKIPAPYAPFLIYQIWEIPIVAAFLLFGKKVGVGIALINTAVLLAVFPGDLPAGPFYNFAAVLSMMFGIFLGQVSLARYLGKRREVALPIVFTTLGTLFRVVLMTVVNLVFLRYPFPVGFEMPVEAIMATLPVVGFFNATLALYTIPVGYLSAKIVGSSLKTVALD